MRRVRHYCRSHDLFFLARACYDRPWELHEACRVSLWIPDHGILAIPHDGEW